MYIYIYIGARDLCDKYSAIQPLRWLGDLYVHDGSDAWALTREV